MNAPYYRSNILQPVHKHPSWSIIQSKQRRLSQQQRWRLAALTELLPHRDVRSHELSHVLFFSIFYDGKTPNVRPNSELKVTFFVCFSLPRLLAWWVLAAVMILVSLQSEEPHLSSRGWFMLLGQSDAMATPPMWTRLRELRPYRDVHLSTNVTVRRIDARRRKRDWPARWICSSLNLYFPPLLLPRRLPAEQNDGP